MIKDISILGLGWLGLPLAIELEKKGYQVHGSTSRLSNLKTFEPYNFKACHIKLEADALIGDWESFIENASVLILNFPPKRVEGIEKIHPAQIQQIINKTARTTKVIFVSSTSVYQNTNGVVDESIACVPEKASGMALVAAEKMLKEHFGSNLTVLRLAGLIGPKRHPGRFLANKRQLKNPNGPVNLIHQKDVIGLISSILELDCFGTTINGCADTHPNRKEFYEKAAEALKLLAPSFEMTSNEHYKIVDNKKSKILLKYAYEFSNPEWIFKEGFSL